MFGNKRSLSKIVEELNEALGGETSKEFTDLIDEYAALKDLKSKISAKQGEIKKEIEKDYHRQELTGNVKHSGIRVGIGVISVIKMDLEKFDAKKLYGKFPEAFKLEMKPGYVKTMMEDSMKKEMLEGMGVIVTEEKKFKVT